MTEAAEPPTQPFIITKEYRRFAEFCDACRRDRYIGVCVGAPGVGKTLSARYYATGATQPYRIPGQIDVHHSFVYTPAVTNTPKQIERDLRHLRWHIEVEIADETETWEYDPPRYLEAIIIDEADRLKMASLEQIRDCYDRWQIGLILIGMPGLEKRLARYQQLYSRVGFFHQFRALSREEVSFILEHQWGTFGLLFKQTDFTDAEALAAVLRITGGNFRLLQRLFSQIERILQINQIHTISKEVVETARENLVIGIT